MADQSADQEKNSGRTIVLANLVTGFVLVLFGLVGWFWLIPSHVVGAMQDHGTIGQGFMPRIAVAAMGILGGLIAAGAIVQLKQGDLESESQEDSEENEILVFGKREIVNTVILIVICTAYVLLFKWTGFVVASALLLFLLIRATGFKNLPVTLAISILLPLALQELLWRVLQIPLPDFPRIL